MNINTARLAGSTGITQVACIHTSRQAQNDDFAWIMPLDVHQTSQTDVR